MEPLRHDAPHSRELSILWLAVFISNFLVFVAEPHVAVYVLLVFAWLLYPLEVVVVLALQLFSSKRPFAWPGVCGLTLSAIVLGIINFWAAGKLTWGLAMSGGR